MAPPARGNPMLVADLLRITAVATRDPEPESELAAWRADLECGQFDDPAETRARLDGYARGEWVLVRLDVSVHALCRDSLVRYPAGAVSGCWFEPGREQQNLKHAQEMIANNLERIGEQLASQGVDFELSALEQLDVVMTIDDELAPSLAGA